MQIWLYSHQSFLYAELRRFGIGCTTGAVIAVLLRWFTGDSTLASSVRQKLAGLSTPVARSLLLYKAELIALGIGVTVIVLTPLVSWLWKYARAWWAGISSLTTFFTIGAAVAILALNSTLPVTIGAVLPVAILVLIEWWRNRAKPRHGHKPQLDIPIGKTTSGLSEQQWELSSRDDPISDWNEDAIGRAAVVEMLADHTFILRTPVVALQGGLGDGKTSILNLLRKAVRGHAIVVSFSAWLPGSEATLAIDLFRDIATECRKYIRVPQLSKWLFAYARIITGSVSYLAGLKEILPTQSQRDEIQELRQTLSRVPLPILVLLDELDRMQKEELIVLLKILRGAYSIPNVTFVCAFSPEHLRNELSKGATLSPDYFEKFFPVAVNLSGPDPDMMGRVFEKNITSELQRHACFKDSRG